MAIIQDIVKQAQVDRVTTSMLSTALATQNVKTPTLDAIGGLGASTYLPNNNMDHAMGAMYDPIAGGNKTNEDAQVNGPSIAGIAITGTKNTFAYYAKSAALTEMAISDLRIENLAIEDAMVVVNNELDKQVVAITEGILSEYDTDLLTSTRVAKVDSTTITKFDGLFAATEAGATDLLAALITRKAISSAITAARYTGFQGTRMRMLVHPDVAEYLYGQDANYTHADRGSMGREFTTVFVAGVAVEVAINEKMPIDELIIIDATKISPVHGGPIGSSPIMRRPETNTPSTLYKETVLGYLSVDFSTEFSHIRLTNFTIA